jgi:hypothetical protein
MSQESRNVASAILTARNQEKLENWLRREKLKKERSKERAANLLEWEKSQGVLLAEKYGPRWYWKVKDTIEDSGYADGLRYHDEFEQMIEDERAFQEDAERDRELQATWEREDKEREERRATMTQEEKEVEEEEWEDRLETAFENEQMGYWS